jgi:two-component system, chemotaxis family, sensor kinase CheA
MDMSQYLGLFISETREHLRMLNESVVALERDPDDREEIDSLFRHAHSIKGMAASMEYDAMAELAHRMEDLMDRVRKRELAFQPKVADLLLEGADIIEAMVTDIEQGGSGIRETADLISRLQGHEGAPEVPAVETERKPAAVVESDPAATAVKNGGNAGTVRVRTELLDQLIAITGNLVTTRHRFADMAPEVTSSRFGETLTELSRLLRELHDRVLQVRMMPVSGVMDRFPRLVRDLAKKSGKDAVLEVEGKEIELDRGILEELGDPLVHILRNAVDHGIETPEERRSVGKPESGRVAIRVRQEKDQVVIQVSDDGRGIDPARVAAAAVRKGILSEDEAGRLSPREALLLTCAPGFSTAEKVTDVSGRGVGMDAVKTSVEALGGILGIDSEPGTGTDVTLKLPRSVAIMNVFLVRCGGMTVALPVSRVLHVLEVPAEGVIRREGRLFAPGEEGTTLHFLRELFFMDPSPRERFLPVVVVDAGGGKAGLVVDALVGQQEVYVKPVGRPLQALRGLSGSAVLGDGRGIFILDVAGLL